MKNKSAEAGRSLTEGPIAPAIWMIAWPTMLQNLIAGLQGLVDHAMVGHFVGFQGNAAIGVSWQIFLVVVVFISSLFTGMGVLVARFTGAGRSDRVSRVVYQVFMVSAFLGLFVFAPLGWWLSPALLDLVNAAPAVKAEALPYLRIMFVASLGMMFFFMIGGALRSVGDARTPMRLGMMMTVLNITLNIILIRGLGPIPGLGTSGAALGTVISGLIISAYAIYLLFSGRLAIDLRPAITWRPDFDVIRRVFRFGLPSGFQGIAMNLGGVLLLRYVGSLENSAEAQAAYSVGYNQLFSFITWTSVALMAATSTVVGQSLGAHNPQRAASVPGVAARLGLLATVPIALSFLIVPHALLSAFGMKDVAVLALGENLLAYLSVSGIFLTIALSYTGALQGSGDTHSPMYISIFSQLILPLSICATLQACCGLQPTGIWLAIVVGHFMRCVLSVVRFRHGDWRSIEVDLDDAS